jgi:hypothetical protein
MALDAWTGTRRRRGLAALINKIVRIIHIGSTEIKSNCTNRPFETASVHDKNGTALRCASM